MRHLFQRLLFLGALCACLPALAQNTTARLQGVVRDASGPLPGITVTAVNTESGLQRSTVTGTDGLFNLTLPPGPYTVTTSGTTAFEEQKTTLRLQVGQVIESNFDLKPGMMATAAVGVTAEAAPEVELRSSEVATNVSLDQIQNLPQATRNFLNFATLAPGVRLSHDELRQEISYGAQGATNTNVFIDGTSYKNDILLGGAVGQDSSRGNPFPQNAVQEFRVITQNYKAEYQKASSVIISAVTKSGTNDFHGDVFTYYQNKNLVSQDAYTERRGTPKPEYTRWQPGLSIGGPIAKDKVFFFASYEGNYQDRENEVFLGSNASWPTAFRSQFQSYTGLFQSPFRATLAFGKVSFLLGSGSTLDVSGDYRHETEIRDFGGQTSYQAASELTQDIGTGRVRHTALFGNMLNEATLSFQRYKWNPAPQDNSMIGQDFDGLIRIGNNSTTQNFTQDRFAIRDDLTLTSFQAAGEHVLKGGIAFDYLKYQVVKTQNGNPVFFFRPSTFLATPGDMPYRATIGSGDPDLSTNNRQFGVYVQDDWRINPRLTANVGLRWDFETDMLNNSYVTPANVRTGFASVYPSNYFTDGNDRDTYYGAVQPRIGLSYDVSGDGKTIVHAGYGKYYDRTLFNDILDEKFRLQYRVSTIWFSVDGSPQDGRPATMWDPSYLSLAGLQALIASGTTDPPEVYLLDNNTRPPSSDQWSAGIRHDFGAFNATLAYAGVYSKNQLTWTCGVKNATGGCDFGARPASGIGFSLISRGKEGWFHSAQFALDKPFTASSKWGAYLSYVYADAKQTGNDLFSFNLLDPIYGTKQRSNIAQEHTILLTGTVALPLEFRFSSIVSLGSGFPFFSTDCSLGFDKCVDHVGGGDPPKWTQSIDFRLEKSFTFGSSFSAGLIAEIINTFNYTNEQFYDGFKPALPEINAHYGRTDQAYNPRRVQFGVRFSF
jgi:outer membrane receptor protein involved in Fe transport